MWPTDRAQHIYCNTGFGLAHYSPVTYTKAVWNILEDVTATCKGNSGACNIMLAYNSKTFIRVVLLLLQKESFNKYQ